MAVSREPSQLILTKGAGASQFERGGEGNFARVKEKREEAVQASSLPWNRK
jgi:hypothetical protein